MTVYIVDTIPEMSSYILQSSGCVGLILQSSETMDITNYNLTYSLDERYVAYSPYLTGLQGYSEHSDVPMIDGSYLIEYPEGTPCTNDQLEMIVSYLRYGYIEMSTLSKDNVGILELIGFPNEHDYPLEYYAIVLKERWHQHHNVEMSLIEKKIVNATLASQLDNIMSSWCSRFLYGYQLISLIDSSIPLTEVCSSKLGVSREGNPPGVKLLRSDVYQSYKQAAYSNKIDCSGMVFDGERLYVTERADYALRTRSNHISGDTLIEDLIYAIRCAHIFKIVCPELQDIRSLDIDVRSSVFTPMLIGFMTSNVEVPTSSPQVTELPKIIEVDHSNGLMGSSLKGLTRPVSCNVRTNEIRRDQAMLLFIDRVCNLLTIPFLDSKRLTFYQRSKLELIMDSVYECDPLKIITVSDDEFMGSICQYINRICKDTTIHLSTEELIATSLKLGVNLLPGSGTFREDRVLTDILNGYNLKETYSIITHPRYHIFNVSGLKKIRVSDTVPSVRALIKNVIIPESLINSIPNITLDEDIW
uniref:Uncharacterized protein n=1 Tax=viral metagenome TaxID=1070528 RepID=A0A6C0BL03_9ZZZZ